MRYGRLFGALAVVAAANPLATLNELRSANGFPGPIAENPAWSAGCAAHMTYLELNGFRGNWHTEEPSRPGYSEAGRAAAGSAVLSNAPSVGLETNWEDWPFHFAQLLAPKLSVTGYADGCMYTWPGYQRPEPPALETFTYPADGARGTTSPYLYVLGYGGGTTSATLSDATLTGPEGVIGLRVVDNHTPGAEGTLPPGGFLVPETALEHDTPYSAQVTFTSDAGVREIKRWSFSTGTVSEGETPYAEAEPTGVSPAADMPAARTPKITLALARTRGGGTQARITTRGLTIGRRARVTVQRLDCTCRASTRTLTLTRTSRRITLARPRRARHGQGQRLLGGRDPLRGPDAGALALLGTAAGSAAHEPPGARRRTLGLCACSEHASSSRSSP